MASSIIYSCSFTGLNCNIIEVEIDISQGLPGFSIVGLGDTSVLESRERVRSGIKNSGATFPPLRKTINLAPAEIKKQGTLFDLPIAMGILLASEQIPGDKLKNSIIIGELSLDGSIKPISGALPIAQHAKKCGFKKIFLPKDNALEASFINDIEVYPLNNLKEFIEFCSGNLEIKKQTLADIDRVKGQIIKDNNLHLTNIIGLKNIKRALSIAASGGHNLLMKGPPGTGKTILARAFSELLPEMNNKEILETTNIFSIAGLTSQKFPLIATRPFREVHHSASVPAIVGGGHKNPQPGEISLAHNGVLFFDEIPEFHPKVLEALRQPLEDKYININRANFSARFPCNFIFIATMNPCPCGYKGDKKIACICTANQIYNYQKRISGPIMDRFDIFLEVNEITMKNFWDPQSDEYEKQLFQNIKSSSEIQRKRYESQERIHKNADMTVDLIKEHCKLSQQGTKILNDAIDKMHLSNRSYIKTLKLSRSIADFENSANILECHVSEALQYRNKNLISDAP